MSWLICVIMFVLTSLSQHICLSLRVLAYVSLLTCLILRVSAYVSFLCVFNYVSSLLCLHLCVFINVSSLLCFHLCLHLWVLCVPTYFSSRSFLYVLSWSYVTWLILLIRFCWTDCCQVIFARLIFLTCFLKLLYFNPRTVFSYHIFRSVFRN